jgi:hypothetical protein
VKPTEILLDLSEFKLGRIVKKDFEEVIVEISAKLLEPTPAVKRLETKGMETKGAETLPTAPTAPIKMVESKVAETAIK